MADRRLLHRLCTATSSVALLALRASEFEQVVAETRTHPAALSP